MSDDKIHWESEKKRNDRFVILSPHKIVNIITAGRVVQGEKLGQVR